MAGPNKMKSIRVACPLGIVFPLVQDYMDGQKWKIIKTDLSLNYLESTTRGIFGNGMRLEASVHSLAPEAPNESVIALCSYFPTTKVFAGGILQKALDEFESVITEKVQAAVETGRAAASQWRPSV